MDVSVQEKQVIYNFTGKNFVVTGASSGMGRQIVMELADAGASIMAIARKEDNLRTLQAYNLDRIYYTACDVRDNAKLEISIANFVSQNGKLDGCIHAAGINDVTLIKMYSVEKAKEIMETSFWGSMNLVQICTKKKYSNEGTSNILFSSVQAYSPEKGMFAYAGAKAATYAGVKAVAKELASRKHRINVIVPGWIKTKMMNEAAKITDIEYYFKKHLLGEGHPEDVSGVILFLLSNRASWITGTDIVIDGGYLA